MKFIKTRVVPVFMTAALFVLGALTAFASGGSATPSITAEMLSPVVDSINANVGVIIPVFLSIFGLMIGIGLIPKLLKKSIN